MLNLTDGKSEQNNSADRKKKKKKLCRQLTKTRKCVAAYLEEMADLNAASRQLRTLTSHYNAHNGTPLKVEAPTCKLRADQSTSASQGSSCPRPHNTQQWQHPREGGKIALV